MGPTASGKSLVAEWLAERLDAQLISADAFMAYRGLDIGSNKPLDKNRYAGLDLLDLHESYGVGAFVGFAAGLLGELWERQQNVVVVGGTGLYIRALFDGWTGMHATPDPELRASLESKLASEGLESLVRDLLTRDPGTAVDLKNPVRVRRALEKLSSPPPAPAPELPPFRKSKIGIAVDVDRLNARIATRAGAMFDQGWREEVENLGKNGAVDDLPAMRAIGYSSVIRWIRGEFTRDEAIEEVVRLTRQYAKRQRTWLRREEGLVWLSEIGPIEQMSGPLQAELEAIFLLG